MEINLGFSWNKNMMFNARWKPEVPTSQLTSCIIFRFFDYSPQRQWCYQSACKAFLIYMHYFFNDLYNHFVTIHVPAHLPVIWAHKSQQISPLFLLLIGETELFSDSCGETRDWFIGTVPWHLWKLRMCSLNTQLNYKSNIYINKRS